MIAPSRCSPAGLEIDTTTIRASEDELGDREW
jgi:hypothetical protein